MKFRQLLFIFFVNFFVIEVCTDDENNIPMTFVGLQGDESMGHIGYVYVSTDITVPKFELSGCKNMDINETMCRISETKLQNDGTVLLLRAWTAATLNENILSVLGYLLHQTKVDFNKDDDISLKFIYDQVQKNNIKILEFLPRFKQIIKLNGARRSIAFFRALQVAMPSYCRSVLEELVLKFFKLKNNAIGDNNTLDDIPSHKIGVYLMANIDPKVSRFLCSKVIRRVYDRVIGKQFGREYAIFFSAIQTGKLVLTQPVLAVLMSITRFSELLPHENEDLKFLIDALIFNKIPDWDPSRSVNLMYVNDPYVLIKKMMKAIANHSPIDPTIKNIATIFQTRLTSGYTVDRIKPMSPFFEGPDLNITMILEILEETVPISETKSLYDMIVNGTIDLNYALKGFNRYYYDTRDKLLLAFVRRIQNRVPMDEEIKDQIQNIIFYLLKVGTKDEYEYYYDNDLRNRRDTGNSSNVNSYVSLQKKNSEIKAEYTQTSLSQTCDSVDGCITTVFHNTVSKTEVNSSVETRKSADYCPIELPGPSLSLWLKDLDAPISNDKASLLVANASTVLKIFMNDSLIINYTKQIYNNEIDKKHIVNNLSLNATISQDNSSTSHKESVQDIDDKNVKVKNNNSASIITKKDLLKQILKEMLSIKKVRVRSVVYYEVLRLYCILIRGLGNHKPTTLENDVRLDQHHSDEIIKEFSLTVSDTFRNLINEYVFFKNLSSTELEKNVFTNRHFLIYGCKEFLTLTFVKENDELFNEIILFLHSIQDNPIKLSHLMQYIGSLSIDNFASFRVVYEYLDKPIILRALGDDFDIGRYPTKGRLFKAVMEKIVNHSIIQQYPELLHSFQAHIPEIVCSGHGAESSIELLLAVESNYINIYQVIEYAAEKAKNDPNFQHTISNMFNWLSVASNSSLSLRNMDPSKFETREQFFRSFLDSMEGSIEHNYNEIKKDIVLMRSNLLENKNQTKTIHST